jgi:glycosyltransferase involved in cell wall biosynthesis
MHTDEPRVAVLIPCRDEGRSIGRVVRDFRAALPAADVYVYDNGSSDDTAERAAAAGARVRVEPVTGKGNVVRRMFADIDADVYVMADGDGTYDAAAAPQLVGALLDGKVDMVVGTRCGVEEDAGRRGHALGNRLFNRLFRRLFGSSLTDVFSGYRVFTRRFVRSFPAVSAGFEIETEMSVHAGQLSIPVAEVETGYGRRDSGSASKLRTFSDGARILRAFVVLLKETRPLLFFGSIGGLLALGSLVLAAPLLGTYLETGAVPRFPTAILATGMMILAFLLGSAGLILDSLARSRVEHKRLVFLSYPAAEFPATDRAPDAPPEGEPGEGDRG